MTENKNEQTLEQLEKAYADMGKLLQQRRKEENDRRNAELANTKEARKKEIRDAFDKCDELCKAYIKDYGKLEISSTKSEDGFLPFFKRYFWF